MQKWVNRLVDIINYLKARLILKVNKLPYFVMNINSDISDKGLKIVDVYNCIFLALYFKNNRLYCLTLTKGLPMRVDKYTLRKN